MKTEITKKMEFSANTMLYGILAFLILLLVGLLTGCQTSAKAYTETLNLDGTKTISYVIVKGSGDKTSEVIAEGMFADGTTDDLGAGVKKAEATQQSTGTDQILANIIPPLVQAATGMMGTYYGYRTDAMQYQNNAVTSPVASGGQINPSICDDPENATGGTTGTTGAIVAGFGASPGIDGIGVYGRPTCSRSRSYYTNNGIELINIDVTNNKSAMWSALRARGFTGASAQLPVVITEEGYTQAAR